MRALLVINSRSRRGAESGERVREQLRNCGIEFVEDDHESVDAVIAGGGDGTIIRAVPVAMERKVPLGIVPLGTFNDLARTLGVPLDVDEACSAIAGGKTRTIDVGRVNGQYFVNEASIGLSTRIARKQTPEVKRRFGWLAIAATTIQTLREAFPFHVSLEHEGGVKSSYTVQVTVANSNHFGGIVEIPDATIDDAQLDLFSVEVRSWFGVFPILGAIAARRFTDAPGVRHYRGPKFTVKARRKHHVTTDGEPAGFTPATFEVVPQAVQIYIAQE